MSRIHEALKKAEQERAAGQPTAPPAVAAEPDVLPLPEAAVPRTAESVASQFMPNFAGSFNVDTLLARCPQTEWKPDFGTMLFMNGDDMKKGTEEFRTLRSRLYHMREKMSLKKLLVTSALPKEGKSFTSCNLAQVIVRQHGRRVLLIDADLRGPRLHLMLGTTPSPGLSDYLQGKNDEFSIMQRGPLENLFFIPSGTGIEDPAELVGNGRLKTFLQRVEPLFDWIIVDSPPLLPLADTTVWARLTDGTLLVTRQGKTEKKTLQRGLEMIKKSDLLGVVLNSCTNPEHDNYYQRYSPPRTK